MKIKIENELIQATPELLIQHNIKIGTKTKIEDNVILNQNTNIGDNVIIKGNTGLGENVEIGHFTNINNSIIGNNVKIGHHEIIDNSIIQNNTELGNSITIYKGDISGKLKFNKSLENGIYIKQNKLNIFYTGGEDITINCETYKLKEVIKDIKAFAKNKNYSQQEASEAMKFLPLINQFNK